MSLFFWRKPAVEKRKPRVLELPEDKRFELLRLIDEFDDNKSDKKKRRYKLWKYIAECLPEVKEGAWNINTEDATNPKIVEDFQYTKF